MFTVPAISTFLVLLPWLDWFVANGLTHICCVDRAVYLYSLRLLDLLSISQNKNDSRRRRVIGSGSGSGPGLEESGSSTQGLESVKILLGA